MAEPLLWKNAAGTDLDVNETNPLPTQAADGANAAQGATTDAAYTSGAGTVVSILKGIFARLRGGQATMANSLPVTLASDQGAHPVTVAAGEAHIGSIGGNTVAPQATFARPANATAYAAGQVVANSTSAAAVLTFANAARVAALSGIIAGAVLVDESNQATKGSFELWLFAGTAAPTTQNDGAAFAPATADIGNLVGVIPFPVSYVGNVSATATGSVAFPATGLNIPFVCGAANRSLYGILVVRNAYAPISGETFVATLQIVQD